MRKIDRQLADGRGGERNHTTVRKPGPQYIIQYSLTRGVIVIRAGIRRGSPVRGFWMGVRGGGSGDVTGADSEKGEGRGGRCCVTGVDLGRGMESLRGW